DRVGLVDALADQAGPARAVRVAVRVAAQQLGEAAHRVERVADLVRDARGERAQAGHLVQRVQARGQARDLGAVVEDLDRAGAGALRTVDGGAALLDQARCAVLLRDRARLAGALAPGEQL